MGDEDEPFLPPDSPLIPIIILLVIGLIIGFILAVRNCCTRQLLSHHVQKKIARGGTLSKNPSFISTHNHINNNKNKEKEPFIKQPQDYGSIAATRLFEDLYAALSRRKEKSGKPSKLRMLLSFIFLFLSSLFFFTFHLFPCLFFSFIYTCITNSMLHCYSFFYYLLKMIICRVIYHFSETNFPFIHSPFLFPLL